MKDIYMSFVLIAFLISVSIYAEVSQDSDGWL